MGEILAVDFFIGNGDRFEDQDKKAPNARGTIKGDQNVFFKLKDDAFQAVGIDTYDAGGVWSDLTKTIEDVEPRNVQDGWGTWPGRILAPGSTRHRDAAARAVVESLVINAWSHPRTQSFPTKLVKDQLVKACHKGISEAKGMLRKKFSLNDSHQGMSKGLASRWKIVKG